MRFGFVLENYGGFLDRNHLIETSRWAEESGFSSIWATDHVLPPRVNDFPRFNTITEAITTVSFLAGVTDRIMVGISTLVLPLRNPVLVAKQLTSLNFLTDGRVMISFGAGLSKGEFEFMNMSFSNRGRRFDESLELVKALWSGKDTFEGTHYSFEDASFSPNDPDSNTIPIWIAGNNIVEQSSTLTDGIL
ncbi:MAG: LLM class flavin-dependent oxidoreductase [Candidatus Thorarchaeota archaeon]|jgi:alkanesulfonate monooxygenase SsuD/methylene tetrahydromethanopterin reductase-like flavin-dependent oxidoreductase (luciferase family)